MTVRGWQSWQMGMQGEALLYIYIGGGDSVITISAPYYSVQLLKRRPRDL